MAKRGFVASFIILSAFFLIAPGNVHANDTFVYDNGRSVYPLETDDVRMVSEKITVRMGGKRGATVHCNFVFENTTDRLVKARLGFPASPGDWIYEEGEKGAPPLFNFKSYIAGKEAAVDVRLDKTKKWAWMYWYTWDVTFPPMKTINLQNEYKATLSMSYYHYWFEYILTTGANWKGPIGKSEVEIIFKDAGAIRDDVAYVCPDGYKINGNRIYWEFKNLVPKDNIQLFFKGHEYYSSTFGQLIDLFKHAKYEGNLRTYDAITLGTPVHLKESLRKRAHIYLNVNNKCMQTRYMDNIEKQYVRLKRNEIFARHGKTFNTPELQKFFKSMSWYRSDPEYSDDMLEPVERKNIEMIVDYEKKMGWR